jgi:hypothetical protein
MAEDSSKKNNKKFAVGSELPPSPTTSTSKTKRPTRHHVKRRSSGRVHVTKLAPMARAAEDEDKKSIKRSHSQKSLHRLPSNDKRHTVSGFTSTASTEDTSPHSPPSTPPLQPSTITKRKPSFTISNTGSPAAPIELPLSVTANNIASPDTPIFDMKKPLLKSQFINNSNSLEQIRDDDMEQYQQEEQEMSQVDQWLQKLTHEYQCVKQHRDPMRESIMRCQQQQQQKQKSHNRPNNHQRTVSYSVLEEKKHNSPYEQRRQILLKTTLQRQHQEQEARNNRWTTGTFLDRLLYG